MLNLIKQMLAGKKRKEIHNKVSYNYLGSPTQVDHNSRSHNIHTYSLFCLVVLALENPRKLFLLVTYRNQVFSYFHFQLKSKKEKNNKNEKFHTLFFNMT